MIDGGMLMMLIGAASLLVQPAYCIFAHRRWLRTTDVALLLQAAFPIAPAEPTLDQLRAAAEAALARDALSRGIRGVAAIYDGAALS